MLKISSAPTSYVLLLYSSGQPALHRAHVIRWGASLQVGHLSCGLTGSVRFGSVQLKDVVVVVVVVISVIIGGWVFVVLDYENGNIDPSDDAVIGR